MRGFIAALLGALVLSACEDNSSVPPQGLAPFQTVEVEIPEGDRPAVVRALRNYSHANGFRFAARTTGTPGSGQSVMFELRRHDLRVIGANAMLDPPREPRFEHGRPQLGEVWSRSQVEVSFYRGTEPASAQFYEASTTEIVSLLDSIAGVEIINDSAR